MLTKKERGMKTETTDQTLFDNLMLYNKNSGWENPKLSSRQDFNNFPLHFDLYLKNFAEIKASPLVTILAIEKHPMGYRVSCRYKFKH